MRKNFGKQSWVLPQPVLIIATYDEKGNVDAMNAAWGGMYDYDLIQISLSPHRTTDNIAAKKAFTVSFGDEKHLLASDYVGIVSANKEPKKMEKAGFTVRKSEFVDAPVINELPVALECELVGFNDDGNVIGRIVNVCAETSVLGADGNIDLDKLGLIVFDPVAAAYRRVGEKVGKAFADGKKLM